MVRQEGLAIAIIPVSTCREPDGFAMSSRNRFLSKEARGRALAISQALCEAQRARCTEEAEGVMVGILAATGIRPDYAVARDAETLMPRTEGEHAGRPIRLLIAARVGAVRLLDNATWKPASAAR